MAKTCYYRWVGGQKTVENVLCNLWTAPKCAPTEGESDVKSLDLGIKFVVGNSKSLDTLLLSKGLDSDTPKQPKRRKYGKLQEWV